MMTLRTLPKVRLVLLFLLALLAVGASATEPSATEPLRLHLIWTNDVHGHIAPEAARFMNPEFPPPLGGAASAATYIKRVRAQAEANGEHVLLVDVGDMFQGTPIGTKTEGKAVIDYFNAIGYDLAVPGNHDFDLGRDVTEARARQSKFPWVACNLVETATGEVVDWCVPELMLEIGGIKIGVVGIITPGTKHMSFPENIEGLDFLPMAPAIEKSRDSLLAQGADIIMLGIHEGLPYDPLQGWANIAGAEQTDAEDEQGHTHGANYSGEGVPNLMELMNQVSGIDFAVGGHTHRGYHDPWIDPVNHTLCFESFGNGSSIGHAILLIDPDSRQLVGWERSHDRGTLITLFEDEIEPDPEITEVLRPYIEETQRAMARQVGTAAVNLSRGGPGNSLMGNLVTDAMRTRFDADFSFQNMGGLRADLPAGPITAGDVFSVLPFGNELVIIEIDGRMLRRIIERKLKGTSGGICISGAEVTYDKNRPDWDRAVSLTVGGEPWDPERIYKAVCTNFLLEGNSGLGFLTGIEADKVMPTQTRTSEAVEWYIEQHDPVRPRIDSRWVEKPGQAQAPYLAVEYLP